MKLKFKRLNKLKQAFKKYINKDLVAKYGDKFNFFNINLCNDF